MPTPRKPYAQRPFWQRWYWSVMTWLWFGPLTRDLRPARPPSPLRQAYYLLLDVCRMAAFYVSQENDRRSRRRVRRHLR